MFFVLQFPFADLREFLGEETGRLIKPMNRTFIRSSGPIMRRHNGCTEKWGGEDSYCRSDLALRFPNHLSERLFAPNSIKATVVDTFRRFYSIRSVSRFEVGLQIRSQSKVDKISASEWIKLLRDVLCIPMYKRNIPRSNSIGKEQKVQNKQQQRHVELIHARKFLAQHYLAATTNRQVNPPVKPKPWWFSSGKPALIIEVDANCSLPHVFPHTRHVLDVPEAAASIFHTWLDFDNQQSCSTWFIAMGKGDPDAVRRLRINLTRLHTERECLNIALANIGILNKYRIVLNENFNQLDVIRQYIKESLASIQTDQAFGMDRKSMFAAAHEAFRFEFEGPDATLQSLGWQLAENVENYIRRAEDKAKIPTVIHGGVMITNIKLDGTTIYGSFQPVIAENITNSFNKIGESKVNNNLKEKLKELTIEVANLAKQLSPDEAEAVTRDLKALTEEVNSPKPRNEWYELSLKGISEAAKSVASMIEPITTSVTAVRAALAIL